MSQETIDQLLAGVTSLSWQSVVMFGVAGLLLYLAIVKDYEPLLLLPIAAGCLLANLPLSPVIGPDGLLTILYDAGIENELFPLLIFIGIGAMTDFGPLLENPKMVLLGAAGQFGIFAVMLLALAIGFTRPEAASIGVIGAIDGPTSIYVVRDPRSAAAGPHHRGRVQLHGARAADHAAGHAPAHDGEGAEDPDDVRRTDGEPADPHRLPGRGDHGRGHPRAVRDAARGLADAGQPHARVAGAWSA